MRLWGAILVLSLGLPAAAQRDFLTADEADQIRLMQEPNARLMLYVKFAQQRLDLLKQLFASDKPGRSVLIHDVLDQYTAIIDAIDTVSDDALARKLDIKEGMAAVTEAEKQMLEVLRGFEASQPKHLARYQFSLQQAIETTDDSLELSLQDLGERAAEVETRQELQEKKLEGMMQPKDLEAKKEVEKKAADEEKKRKPPTLYRKGEQKKEQK